ncbi:hypothetical protein CVO_08805 [Sulfurimonas sp. CVO]|jgi:uncharacterized protein YeeX (DUF496 family)|uniref:Uncharacterized protein n=1 Tax=Sulfurimonas xiamenensis TaxID=2590021 RepID=A0AAJ4A258_9BACT|nr:MULTISPECIES: hypothetical protein [Sulfurimonas]QFR42510.1 hypothetical protein FJR47_00690 [Sulfurimonas xiamenensis]QHG91913.1 hypothetical protein CVO_08805 [Sulfurimonas sp. CVO]
MLTPKEISNIFEVQINTLYNWQKTKPKLYRYLQNADYNIQQNDEINLLLQEYSSIIKLNFTFEEILYIIDSPMQLLSMEDVKEFQKVFITVEYKNIPKNQIILSIYDKILDLNIIEKYILYKKIYKYRQFCDLDINEYFKEFIA